MGMLGWEGIEVSNSFGVAFYSFSRCDIEIIKTLFDATPFFFWPFLCFLKGILTFPSKGR